MRETREGTVKWFSTRRGYGFITGEDGLDSFVHFSEIRGEGYRSLKTGEQVSYEIEDSERGMRARNVIRLNAA